MWNPVLQDYLCFQTDSPSSRRSCGSKLSVRSSPRALSLSSASPITPEGLYAIRDVSVEKRSDDGYYTPPDASRHSGDIRTSLIPSFDTVRTFLGEFPRKKWRRAMVFQVEKSGYWNQMSDSRLKSLKRRYVVLKNNQLTFFRTAVSCCLALINTDLFNVVHFRSILQKEKIRWWKSQ